MSVLLIENDLPAMKLMAWALREDGYHVDSTTIDHAPERAAETKPSVVVFNTQCPVDERRSCIGRLRASTPGVAIVDLSDGADDPAHDTGADAYLSTPVQLDELRAALKRLDRP